MRMRVALIAAALAGAGVALAGPLDSNSVPAPPRPTPEATPTPESTPTPEPDLSPEPTPGRAPSPSPEPTPLTGGATPTPTPAPAPEEGPPIQSEGAEKPHPEEFFEPEITGGLSERFIRIDRESDAVERGMSPIDPIETAAMTGAILRGLDRMTGEITTFEMPVGTRRAMARLRVELLACQSPEGGDVSGTMAFLRVWDTKGGQETEVFSGWMFAASPALSAMDHPRYDLWLINCTTS